MATDGLEKLWLHGVLKVTITELNLQELFHLWANVNDHLGGCFATLELPPVQLARTRRDQCQHGVVAWNETLRVYTANKVSFVVISITSGAHSHPQGKAKVAVSEILLKRRLEGWFIVDGWFKDMGKIHVVIDFEPAAEHPLWGHGVGENFQGVPNTYFPQHKGCLVTPYQNSHVEDDFAPPIHLKGGKHRVAGKYWKELYEAICNAKKFVYIAGWSMFAKVSLVRNPDGELSETIGELLIRRANEGIRVLVMVWDDKTSNLHSFLKSFREGIMHTHDEDTAKYFKNTNVVCFKCPRNPRAAAFHLAEGVIFTHHQKVVVVDAPALPPYSSELRRIIAFVGGIDLCEGRYDTPSHSLFRTLTTVHRKDFRQGCIPGAEIRKGGPRQPWHDIHSKLEGAVAWDAHTNFVQRWLCQAGEKRAQLLVPIDPENSNFCPPSPAIGEQHPSAWNVQLLRSIDTTSVVGFPVDDPKLIVEKGLVREETDLVDRSIQDAYICAIRRARNFIFIENQYFIGSTFGWRDLPDWHAVSPQLIPIELALKIVSKIHAGEHFCVYVIVPMMPDGAPDGPSVQDILHHVRETMQMMYQLIGEALREVGRSQEKVTDYLCLFCLGNREAKKGHELIPEETPDDDSHYGLAQTNRRFEIYCHAKIMIVDDEYLIIGSANINQRSMDGGRDTEMAMGCYQPQQTFHTHSSGSRGEVYGFRMSLWYEHLGCLLPEFDHPGTVECMRKVEELASHYWQEYIRPPPVEKDLPGHLLVFPFTVTEDGQKIFTEAESQHFPDTNAPVLGSRRPVLPGILTA
ncbi:hypothetical protein R1flu_012822 [Riccia fluitans]|uniref:Phospholipase D n=1 Tax=Riccia fluitans TaxID=41844 RepID=A0ABD1ZBW3_9MARC